MEGLWLLLALVLDDFTIMGLLNWSQKLPFFNGVCCFSKTILCSSSFKTVICILSQLQSLKVTLERTKTYYINTTNNLMLLVWLLFSVSLLDFLKWMQVFTRGREDCDRVQAQFGNRWAKIASFLSGRTDNDVKNFWSSRQKRLARILQTSGTTSKSQKNKTKVPTLLDVPTLEVIRWRGSSISMLL